MGAQSYLYQSDTGQTWQVVLDDSLASQLSYLPASGTEPYLPFYIQMRYCTYQAVASGVWLQAYLPNKAASSAPPATVQIGMVLYQRRSYIGESQSTGASGILQAIAGPQGPPGKDGSGGGSLVALSSILSSDINPLASAWSVCNSLTLASGTWLVWATLDMLSDATPLATVTAQIYDSTNAVVLAANGQQFASAADRRTITQCALTVVFGSMVVQSRVKPSAGTVYIYSQAPAGGEGTGLFALKVA
jgi:hypothetical protein